MNYRYATASANYEDFAAGRVLQTASGMTAFPVRLASELFQRGAAYLPARPLRVWDPCCGSGALLTVLGFLHSARLESLWAADVDPAAVTLARKNLALLTPTGLQARQHEIEAMQAAFGKDSHDAARRSASTLRAQLPASPIACATWVGDALEQTLPPGGIDLIFTDVPYGSRASWQGHAGADPVSRLLDRQQSVLADPGVVILVSDKAQKANHPDYHRLEQIRHGKRLITLLQPRR